MDELRGLSLLGFERAALGETTFHAQNPANGERLAPPFHAAGCRDVEHACRLAHDAFELYGALSPARRAAFLESIADGLETEAGAVLARVQLETALPAGRVRSELGRTCQQLRLFADVVLEGSWVDARIDTGDPQRQPTPKPDVRSLRRPLGPVVVFGASNFPLAFSVAGGDTASALAAGNPVIVKAHPSHPGTAELVGLVIVAAAQRAGLPDGTFSLLFDGGLEIGQALVRHPLVRGVAFTGSRAGGEALMRLAALRPDPIPVYAEMSSVNPVFVFPGALRSRAQAIAEGLHASFTLGVGQFCTNPGVVLVEAGAAGDALVARLAELTRGTPAAAMLSTRLSANYCEGLERLKSLGTRRLAEGPAGEAAAAGRAAIHEIDAARVVAEPRLLAEVFGPSTLVVRYANLETLAGLVDVLEGQLTATVHAEPEELASQRRLLERLARKAGRLVFNQFPTGVEVNHAMVHGGPFPATSDGRSTSVGTRAIERFSRLVAYQNFPQQALPEELQDANPRSVRRMLDGVLSGA